ncbi:MAG: nitroreductase family protein [Candidatus Bipolaricaulota bacterium]
MELYGAIKKRRSVRNYPGESLSTDELDRVEYLLGEAGEFQEDKSVSAYLIRDGNGFQDNISGLIADYGKVEAPHYLLLSSRETEGTLVEIGYRYEFVTLALTEMGVGTCWIGKGFSDEDIRKSVELPVEHTARALIAFGPVADRKLEVIEEPNRKELSAFIIDGKAETVSRDVLEVVEALRRAPSSINSQPWRVQEGEDSLHLYIGRRSTLTRKLIKSLSRMNRIDGGIGLRHMEVAGNYLWGEVDVEKAEHPERKGWEYIASISK